MRISSPVKHITESITLKLNATAIKMAEDGKKVFNLTAGQLPFKPAEDFIESIKLELNFLKSFQYSPASGFPDLRKKILDYIEKTRNISFKDSGVDFECVISSGAKHALTNVFASIINPGDKVLIFTPHWISYPVIVHLFRGSLITVKSGLINGFIPPISEVKKALEQDLKAIILNTPNNPTGIYYPESWMRDFAKLLEDYPDVLVICDEIYYELSYFDPKPTFFYQFNPKLLKQTIIFDGISKSLASTGLRLGYCVGPKELLSYVGKLQGQTTSGANSLTQNALVHFDFHSIPTFLKDVNNHLRDNSKLLRDKLNEYNLGHTWYQINSAFYFLLELSSTPFYKSYIKKHNLDALKDNAPEICQNILENSGVVIVPSSDFGVINYARVSLVLEKRPFTEAIDLLLRYLTQTV